MGFSSLYEIYPESESATVPLGLRVNEGVLAARIDACDPSSGAFEETLEAQVRACFAKIAGLLESAGGGLENLGRATAFVTQKDHRPPVNREWWYEIFPDPDDRPAYKVILAELPSDQLVQFDVLGVLGCRRVRFDLPGIPAHDPTVRIGNYIFSSRCHGIDGATGQVVEGGTFHEALVTFDTLRRLAEAAGGSPEDIVQLNAFGITEEYIAPTLEAFDRAFADVDHKPVLNTLINFIEPRFKISVDMVAVIGKQP